MRQLAATTSTSHAGNKMKPDNPDSTIADVYLKDLKKHIEDFNVIDHQFAELSEARKTKSKIIKNLIEFLKGAHGESSFLDALADCGLSKSASKFLTIDNLATAGHKTVVRRRKGSRSATPVAPASIVPKGAAVKLLGGKYANWTGSVTTSQARQGRNGLDVTYFLLLKGPDGESRRTSVKHGTLGKSWQTID